MPPLAVRVTLLPEQNTELLAVSIAEGSGAMVTVVSAIGLLHPVLLVQIAQMVYVPGCAVVWKVYEGEAVTPEPV